MNLLFLAQSSSNTASGAGIFAGVGIGVLLLAILTSLFWLWMLIDCATNRSIDGADKIVWILVILFAHVIGAIIYFFVQRSSQSKSL